MLAASPILMVVRESPKQMTLFGEMVVVEGGKKKKR
jgi:hypothetical protein